MAVRENESLAKKLYKRAGKLSSEVKRKVGRGRELLLGRVFLLSVCAGDTISPRQLQAEIHELEADLTAIEELALSQDAINNVFSAEEDDG